MRIIFIGTAGIAVPSLRRILNEGRDEVVAVVTQPDRPAGRNRRLTACPVRRFAEEWGLKVLAPEKVGAPESVAVLAALQPDLFAVAAYGQYIPECVLSIARLRGVNLHPSLLPKYRGAAPIQQALIEGEMVTGISIIEVAREMDAGDIFLQEPFPIGPEDTAGTLHDKLAEFGAGLLFRVIRQLEAGATQRRPQAAEAATFTMKLKKSEGVLDWRQSAEALRNRIRGVTPWPGATCSMPGLEQPLKILQAMVEPGCGEPGMVLAADATGLLIACGQGALRLQQVQPPGKKPMSGSAFLNGFRLQPGSRLYLNSGASGH